MSKAAVTIAVVTACIAAVFAVPAPSAVNWANVAAKVGEIKDTLGSTLRQVRTLANSDNEQVGKSIGVKIDAAVVNATALLQQAIVAIGSQALTPDQAREFVGEVKGTMGQLNENIQPDLALLNPQVAVQIRQLLATSLSAFEVKAQELDALLRS